MEVDENSPSHRRQSTGAASGSSHRSIDDVRNDYTAKKKLVDRLHPAAIERGKAYPAVEAMPPHELQKHVRYYRELGNLFKLDAQSKAMERDEEKGAKKALSDEIARVNREMLRKFTMCYSSRRPYPNSTSRKRGNLRRDTMRA